MPWRSGSSGPSSAIHALYGPIARFCVGRPAAHRRIGAGGNSMLSVNPFAVAGASLPAGFLQWFLVVMAVAVVVGTLFDIIHKGSARYFFNNMTRARAKGRKLG